MASERIQITLAFMRDGWSLLLSGDGAFLLKGEKRRAVSVDTARDLIKEGFVKSFRLGSGAAYHCIPTGKDAG